MRIGCYDNYRCMLKLCMEFEVPIIVNSDAHDPSWVGEFSLAEKLLKEISFPNSLILNTAQDKLLCFLLP
jgi:putative hydrolase